MPFKSILNISEVSPEILRKKVEVISAINTQHGGPYGRFGNQKYAKRQLLERVRIFFFK